MNNKLKEKRSVLRIRLEIIMDLRIKQQLLKKKITNSTL
jgi:hypothetical protein